MKHIGIVLLATIGFLGLLPAALGQFTTVTGTVIDPNGLPYAGGTISAQLILSGTSPTLNGQPYTPPTQPSGLDKNGTFLLNVADNTQLQPGGTQWNFRVCSSLGSIQPAGGKGSVCFSLVAPITISGSAQNISAQLNAVALPLSFSGSASSASQGYVATNNTISNLKCDAGTTDDTAALNALLAGIGSTLAKIVLPSQCLLSTISIPGNVTIDTTPGGGIKVVTGQTVSIAGPVISPIQKIFFNATAGQGTVAFTGTQLVRVYPEWWGAIGNNSTGPVETSNTAAFQAAEIGAFGTNRTNASGLSNFNRILHFSDIYYINGEIQFYHVNGFRLEGENRLLTGISQAASNKRIIDGQNISYGEISNLRFSTSATQNVPLIDLDNDGTHGADLSPQFIDFRNVDIFGNGVGLIGVLIAKTGGTAQGSNINFWDPAFSGFSQACLQFGTPGAYAYNALANSTWNGDFQSCPGYGIAAYAGQVEVHGTTFEDGFQVQTGFDVYCESPQYPCLVENVRSEGRRLAAGNPIKVVNSHTINQASTPQPGNTFPLGTIITGSVVGGDGQYYKVTVSSSGFGGVGTPGAPQTATSGSATTIVNSGAAYTVNAFNGYLASILGGTGIGEYCLVTSNSATTITCAAGWLTKYVRLPIVNPDNTSTFIVEPNWGTQTTSGGMTWAALNENGIEGNLGSGCDFCELDHVDVPGDKIAVGNHMTTKLVTVTRPDWFTTVSSVAPFLDVSTAQISLDVSLDETVSRAGTPFYQSWSFPRTAGITGYANWSQFTLPNKAFCWPTGLPAASAKDVCVGGRSDPGSGTSTSRAVFEIKGMIGSSTPFGTDQNGTATRIQGGLPTGAGLPGAIEFWLGLTGGSGTTVTDGSFVGGFSRTAGGVAQFQVPAGSLATPGLSIGNTVDGFDGFGTHQIGLISNGYLAGNVNGSDGLDLNPGTILGWCAAGGNCLTDAGNINLQAGGVIGIGQSTTLLNSGRLKAAAYMSTGATFSSNGGCTESALVGGASAGKFTVGQNTACTIIITMGNSATAPNGWTCTAYDQTAVPAVAIRQTASTATTCSLLMTVATNDVITFSALGF